jgi:hypothetical protein
VPHYTSRRNCRSCCGNKGAQTAASLDADVANLPIGRLRPFELGQVEHERDSLLPSKKWARPSIISFSQAVAVVRLRGSSGFVVAQAAANVDHLGMRTSRFGPAAVPSGTPHRTSLGNAQAGFFSLVLRYNR